jgi:hypothetical protein
MTNFMRYKEKGSIDREIAAILSVYNVYRVYRVINLFPFSIHQKENLL